MYTEKYLLSLAGELAQACHYLLNSNVYTLSRDMDKMRCALKNYDAAIMANQKAPTE